MAHSHLSQADATVPRFCKLLPQVHQVASPLKQLTSPAKPIYWTTKVDTAFTELKTCFTSTPILIQPDTSWQLIVEMDTFDAGVMKVLSQQSESD